MSLYYYYSCLKNKDKIDVKTTLELFYAEERAMTRAFLTASFSKSEALLSLAKLELSSNPSGISHSSLNTSSLISHRLCNTTQLAIFAGRHFSVLSVLFNMHRKRPLTSQKQLPQSFSLFLEWHWKLPVLVLNLHQEMASSAMVREDKLHLQWSRGVLGHLQFLLSSKWKEIKST